MTLFPIDDMPRIPDRITPLTPSGLG